MCFEEDWLMKRTKSLWSVFGIILVFSSCLRKPVTEHKHDVVQQAIALEPKPLAAVALPTKATVVYEAHLSSDWYNHIPTQLTVEMNNYLSAAVEHFYVEADPQKVRALIVPHAGYYYSGLCAATAYQSLLKTKNLYSSNVKNTFIRKVIILAPSHAMFFNGVALPDFTTYKTVLGSLPVDDSAVQTLAKNDLFKVLPDAFKTEHALEVQLPWIQKTIESCTIVPLIVGNLKDATTSFVIAQQLKAIIDPWTLVVVSSDFVHYGKRFEYDLFKKNTINQVRMLDSLALEAISKKSTQAFDSFLEDTTSTICGQNPIKILLALLEQGFLGNVEARLASYYTSAHLAQAKERTGDFQLSKLMTPVADEKARDFVTYAGLIFTEQKLQDMKLENRLTEFEKKDLLMLARLTLQHALREQSEEKHEGETPSPLLTPGMNLMYGAFVSLKTKKDGALRGCIGNTFAYQPLVRTIIAMTTEAAFNDDRFSPLTKEELDDISIEITVLSQPQRIASPQEIEVGRHGVILNKFKPDGSIASATFLPQVAREQKWDLETMLKQLSLKAGLDEEAWKYGAEFYVYDGIVFSEKA